MHSVEDVRSNARDRRLRRAYLVAKFAHDGLIPCHHCGREMVAAGHEWQVDRFPVCGHDGGRYTRDNIVPACRRCNSSRCRHHRRPRIATPSAA